MSNSKRDTNFAYKSISLCVRTAKSFLKIGKIANEEDLKRKDLDDMDFAPAIVNISFACELSIKALLLEQKIQVPKTHRLDRLFEMIPYQIKQDFKDNFDQRCKYETSLENTINEHWNSFNEWRYIYEEQNFDAYAYIDNLILTVEIIMEYLDHIK